MPKQDKYFYKYRAINLNNINALHDCRIFLSEPKEFNDPFDCVARLIIEKPNDYDISNEEFGQIIKEIEKHNSGYQFTNPLDTMKKGQIEILNMVANLKIYCVSEKDNDHLMWVHYADGLRGFCIEFSRKNADFLRHAAPVNYDDILPSAYKVYKALLEVSIAKAIKNNINDADQKAFKNAIDVMALAKLKDFYHESEWRIAEKGKNSISYKPKDISNIIIGERMDDGSKKLIQTILKDKYPHIKNLKIAKIKGSKIVIEEMPLMG